MIMFIYFKAETGEFLFSTDTAKTKLQLDEISISYGFSVAEKEVYAKEGKQLMQEAFKLKEPEIDKEELAKIKEAEEQLELDIAVIAKQAEKQTNSLFNKD